VIKSDDEAILEKDSSVENAPNGKIDGLSDKTPPELQPNGQKAPAFCCLCFPKNSKSSKCIF
jgi:hypothetical protein